jgi:hypothetical protein
MRGQTCAGDCRALVAFLPDEDAFLILDAFVVFAEDIFPPEEDALLTLDLPSLPRLRLVERTFAMSRDIVPVRATQQREKTACISAHGQTHAHAHAHAHNDRLSTSPSVTPLLFQQEVPLSSHTQRIRLR